MRGFVALGEALARAVVLLAESVSWVARLAAEVLVYLVDQARAVRGWRVAVAADAVRHSANRSHAAALAEVARLEAAINHGQVSRKSLDDLRSQAELAKARWVGTNPARASRFATWVARAAAAVEQPDIGELERRWKRADELEGGEAAQLAATICAAVDRELEPLQARVAAFTSVLDLPRRAAVAAAMARDEARARET